MIRSVSLSCWVIWRLLRQYSRGPCKAPLFLVRKSFTRKIMKNIILILSLAFASTAGLAAGAGKTIKGSVTTPEAGVICDKKANFCADATGISVALTKMYLGDKAEKKLMDMGSFDMSEFVLTNGVRCDTKTQKCTVSKINQTVDAAHTKALFGK
jgi:hypothetical protein